MIATRLEARSRISSSLKEFARLGLFPKVLRMVVSELPPYKGGYSSPCWQESRLESLSNCASIHLCQLSCKLHNKNGIASNIVGERDKVVDKWALCAALNPVGSHYGGDCMDKESCLFTFRGSQEGSNRARSIDCRTDGDNLCCLVLKWTLTLLYHKGCGTWNR